VQEGETVIGTVPLEVRRLYALAQVKAQRIIAIAKKYGPGDEAQGDDLREVNSLQFEMNILEGCADALIGMEFVEQAGYEGTVWVRAGWVVAWNPIVECDCEDEDDEADESGHPTKPLLN
jgi:hypothetical protein